VGSRIQIEYLEGKIMGFFDKIFGPQKSTTEKIQEDRNKIRKLLEDNLKKLNFTSIEIKEVQEIITIAEEDIQVLKDSLIGTNINNPDPTPIMNKVTNEIRTRQIQMSEDIKKKVQEIQKRKEAYKKELE
jgi:hypothetical protein